MSLFESIAAITAGSDEGDGFRTRLTAARLDSSLKFLRITRWQQLRSHS